MQEIKALRAQRGLALARLFVLPPALCLVAVSGAVAQESAGDQEPTPPRAEVIPHELEAHGHMRIDNYYWLNQRENPEVIAYLEAENEYTEAMMAHTEALQEKLFQEIKGRIKETDLSVPYREGDYFYYSRWEEGKDYPIYARKRGSLDAAEEIMLDVNELAEGHGFTSVRSPQVSSDGSLIAFAHDTVGRRFYNIRFKDLETGELLEDEISQVTANVAWANDNRTVFYARQDPVTLRRYQIYRHVLGTDPANDELVYEESDVEFSCGVWKTKNERYVIIGSFQTLSNEYRYLDADDPGGEFTLFLPRERDHEYEIDHFGDHFYILTNDEAQNFRLMRTPVDRTGKDHWEEVISHRDDVLLMDLEIFRDFMVLTERKDGLRQLRVRPWSGEGEHYLDFGEPAYVAYVSANPEIDTKVLRYGYMSMTTPRSIYDYDMETREKTLLKRDEVLGDFDPDDYVAERLHAPARDGVQVPVSIVYRKGLNKHGSNPLLLYGYGSYGASIDPTFNSARLSLLDRGFVFAIAHVRGGEELGRRWYEDGKLLKKKNTFTDFIDVAEFLIAEGYTNPDLLFAQGGSAGGLLMGAVANMRPDLFEGIVARVPWVDVVTTMLDESIPLTTSEYDEWGDPNEEEYYHYMLSYSPYDNVTAQDYPNLLVTTGLHDSQVQYFEPAKWVAKLRALKTDDNLLILKTDMESGHGGASGRYKSWRETAFQYAFLLDLAGTTE
ncbi:MAG: S9 family peptidase [Gemmatimonadetes bacterium]|uniref:S9 family peptidase n=1 Tax=Candidatus Kutchimonas denitrificans TaxID=3056748 RepID=A0AAE4ZB82_9BACT|nr:S9 family peptidase [Gemmatimonadota bacterium]NIR74245.1 S9 family peptidase [Candidatus Kutchimonas denitrificans]NIR99867.1 S9 family peptidase [Gemmatimonadota bacterium]NIT65456.1 S9 family peptidase [Gemmatimonadota bacterium]NIU51821.1 prolyl oligopeptidase family serine peptidase [Gemmatimonadota bacterium]